MPRAFSQVLTDVAGLTAGQPHVDTCPPSLRSDCQLWSQVLGCPANARGWEQRGGRLKGAVGWRGDRPQEQQRQGLTSIGKHDLHRKLRKNSREQEAVAPRTRDRKTLRPGSSPGSVVLGWSPNFSKLCIITLLNIFSKASFPGTIFSSTHICI